MRPSRKLLRLTFLLALRWYPVLCRSSLLLPAGLRGWFKSRPLLHQFISQERPDSFEIIGGLLAAPWEWLELYSVAPRATECPLRVHIHYWVIWQGRSCVKCYARAHGMISLCTLQTSRSLCADPHIYQARLSGERPPSLLGGGGS